MQRRTFLMSAAAASLLAPRFGLAAASERVRVGVMGAGGRALSLNRTFADNPSVEVVTIADIDSRRLPQAIAEVKSRQGVAPKATGDFRRMIDDKSLDAIVIGTPDHWHAIPTIMACMAGKDVYVEKPDAHNIIEGQRMVAAMRKHKRIVQMGSQHRSTTRLQSALEFIHSGALGRCLVAKAWESTKQGSIGRPADADPQVSRLPFGMPGLETNLPAESPAGPRFRSGPWRYRGLPRLRVTRNLRRSNPEVFW